MTLEARVPALRALAERVARSYGLDVFDLHLRREATGLMLRVVLDRPPRRNAQGAVEADRPEDSIGIEECQRVSQDLSALLDVEDALDVHYTLEVSSPGLDRPLRSADDYRRFVGRLAKVVVGEPVDRQSHFEGRLAGVEDDAVMLEMGRTRVARIPFARIARARLDVEF